MRCTSSGATFRFGVLLMQVLCRWCGNFLADWFPMHPYGNLSGVSLVQTRVPSTKTFRGKPAELSAHAGACIVVCRETTVGAVVVHESYHINWRYPVFYFSFFIYLVISTLGVSIDNKPCKKQHSFRYSTRLCFRVCVISLLPKISQKLDSAYM